MFFYLTESGAFGILPLRGEELVHGLLFCRIHSVSRLTPVFRNHIGFLLAF